MSTTASTTTEPPAREFDPLYADPALSTEEQVEAAYLFHWEVLLEAYRTGLTHQLPLIYGEEMVRFRSQEIEGFVAQGQRVEGDIEHNYRIVQIDANHASVVDAYLNRLILVDFVTGMPLEEPSSEEVGYEFQMTRSDDRWLVTHVIRYHFSA